MKDAFHTRLMYMFELNVHHARIQKSLSELLLDLPDDNQEARLDVLEDFQTACEDFMAAYMDYKALGHQDDEDN